MGIVSSVRVKHNQDLSKANRTDNTHPDQKWRGVKFQERFYQAHYGITLHKYRETLDLKNTSWNGAVIDYLYIPKGKSVEDWKDTRNRLRKKRRPLGLNKIQNYS